MSVWSYCRQNSIGYHRMQYWIKKLRRLDPRAATPAKEMFVELSPSPKAAFSSQISGFGGPPPGNPRVELTFPGGLILKIYG